MTEARGRIGEQIGEYCLLRLAGRGSFGEVYLAKHIHEHTQVAVKLLHTPLMAKEDWQAFLNEARSIRLQHPHIVPLLDFGITREEMPFLVMEYAAGGTLRARYARGSQVPPAIIAMYATQLASALQYAHDRQIIHRDVKPENILLRVDDTVLLSDFGVARFLEQNSMLSESTYTGTPAYMAPEQGRGRPCPASDQYALAVVIYEWITGRRPFLGTPIEMALQHLQDPPPALRALCPWVSPQMEQIIARALAKEPEERFESVSIFARELQRAIHELEIENIPARLLVPVTVREGARRETPAEHAPFAPTIDEAEESAARPILSEETERVGDGHAHSARTPILSLANPLPVPRNARVLRHGAGTPSRLLPVSWRVGVILLFIMGLLGSGVFYFARGITYNPAVNGTSIATTMPGSSAHTLQPTVSRFSVPSGWHQALDDSLTASQHNSYWEQDNTCVFRADVYEVISSGSNYCSYGGSTIPATIFVDLSYSMDLSIRQGREAGISFRNIYNNYYYFNITTTGAYLFALHRDAGGGGDTILIQGTSSAIHQGQGQWNTLAIIARAQTFSLYINDQYIRGVSDTTYTQGVIGVVANGPDLQGVSADIWFRNAAIWIP